ncbi:MAG: LysR family transcriptional regulator [Sedimentibacter sp.]
MNTKDLISFLQVCHDGSITKAAKALFITPQGLSKIIINLEQELNFPLFYRNGNGLTLTEYGVLLEERARHLISELDEIENYFNNLNNVTGQINLASAYGVIAAFSPKFLFEFRQKFPNITLKWWEYSDFRAEDAIWNGDSDCGLIKGPINKEHFESIFLASYKPMILVPKNHRLSSKSKISINEIKEEKIIIESSEFKTYHNFKEACKKAGFSPNIVFETTELSLAHKLCQQGMGLAITVDFAVHDMPMNDFVAISFKEDEPKWEVYFVNKKHTNKTPSVKFFEEYMIEYVKNNIK